MTKNKSRSFKVGECVVFSAPNGDSISAKVYSVDRGGVHIEWFASYAQRSVAYVLVADLARLTPFGNSLFLSL